MRKNRLTHLIKQLTMTLKEFSQESNIALETLKNQEIQPDSETIGAIVHYFSSRNHPKEKRLIKNLLTEKRGRLYLYDNNLYEALYDYLSYASPLCRYDFSSGLCRIRQELYTANSTVFRGVGPALKAIRLFCEKASLLCSMQTAIIFYNEDKLEHRGLKEDVLQIFTENTLLPVNMGKFFPNRCPQGLLSAILLNHFLLEVYDAPEPVAVFSCDGARANGAWLHFLGRENALSGLYHYRLAYLLDLLNIRNDALSQLLFVDKTLISKWKNGRRKLKCYDESLYQMAFALYSSGIDNKEKIRLILNAYFILPPGSSDEEQIDCLCKWLAYREEEREVPPCNHKEQVSISYQVYSGLQGLQNAVQSLLHCCKQLKGPFKLYITCFDHHEYLYSLKGTLLNFLANQPNCRSTFAFKQKFAVCQLRELIQKREENSGADSILTELLFSGRLSVNICDPTVFSSCSILLAVPGTAELEVFYMPGITDNVCTHSCFGKNAGRNTLMST